MKSTTLGLTIGTLIAAALCLSGYGCVSADATKGQVKSAWTDPQFKTADWVQTVTNADGSVTRTEMHVRGYEHTGGVESTHMIGNVLCAVVGGLAGTAAAPGPGTAVGIAAGGAGSEIWQTIKDWWNKTAATNTPAGAEK